ncbi:hypothetical protein STTU_p0042 (plasmid) [Streptomyces sp. Tu6071]|uniref:hotdog fold domain-containing protein n=1 Tax=Streptomyces sp. Tu6071 TaxID=355249 RepID=UPI00020E6A3F|nr:hotdog fold domain-containing protein [Streptomyces sp. Tu6071]EGJ72655.1 hypothetical protein STTU_p0042 [Streptomyces sp. Tu6071]
MGWKDEFQIAMGQLGEIREQLGRLEGRLDDPTAGLVALHGQVEQARTKILENVQGGTTGLREENRELRRRQERMISDLSEARAELSRPAPTRADLLESPVSHVPELAEEKPSQETDAPGPALTVVGSQDGKRPTTDEPEHALPTNDLSGDSMRNYDRAVRAERDQDRDLRPSVEAAYRGTSAPAGPASTSGSPEKGLRVAHGVLLLRAAGVASAEVVAHRDTWEWLASLASEHAHFRAPFAVEDSGEGRVRVVVSGRSLIALLITLWDTRADAESPDGDWAMAVTTYTRMANELSEATGGDHEIAGAIRIVLDDGVPEERRE